VARTVDDLLAEARSKIERLEPGDAAAMAAAGAVIVDLRCAEDRLHNGTIPSAVHIPRTLLEWRADPASPTRDGRIADVALHLILMCNDGYSSSLAGGNLRELGFELVSDVVGGFTAWKQQGLPVVETA
jgi:rhodanese-related sulfurtransferase